MKERAVYTVGEYLSDKIRFGVPDGAVRAILADRGIDESAALMDCAKGGVRLAYADLLKWVLTGPGKVNNSSDTDNGWSHTEGGYEIGDADREQLMSEANAIYDELEPSSAIRRKGAFRMACFGVKRANKDLCGDWLPRVER